MHNCCADRELTKFPSDWIVFDINVNVRFVCASWKKNLNLKKNYINKNTFTINLIVVNCNWGVLLKKGVMDVTHFLRKIIKMDYLDLKNLLSKFVIDRTIVCKDIWTLVIKNAYKYLFNQKEE